MGINDLNIEEFLAGEYDPDSLKVLLSEGQSAYQSAQNLDKKNRELIGENRKYQSQYKQAEELLASKGFDWDSFKDFNPNPNNDEQIKKFQTQLENERRSYDARLKEIQTQAEIAAKERDELRASVEQGKIRQAYFDAAKNAGVSPDFIDDYYHVLQGRGIQMYVDQETGEVKAKRGTDVLDYTPEAMLTNLKADSNYQRYYSGKFAGGSGTNPQPGGGRGSVSNPFAKESFNLTEQTRIARENPQLAQQLKQLAEGG
jgi:hypothetical protein